jgi:hypothetical protein
LPTDALDHDCADDGAKSPLAADSDAMLAGGFGDRPTIARFGHTHAGDVAEPV